MNFSTLLGVSCIVVVAAACGPDQNTTILRMTSWQTQAENALDLPAIREFEARNPGVTVVNDPVTNQAEYREKVVTSIASGAPPDVFLLDNIDVPSFVDAGVMLDLRPFATRVGIDLRSFYPEVLGIFSRDSQVFAFPKGFSPVVYYYNRKLFDAAAVAYPRDGWTWDEFVATAKALTKDIDGDGNTDQWGTVIVRPFYAWQAMIWSGGGDILTADGRQASGALDSPATIAALDFLTSLTTRHGVAPPPSAFRAVSGNETRLFYSGRLALLPSGHWLIPNIRTQLSGGKLDLGVVSFPRAPDTEVGTPLFASAWAVPRNTAHRKLAVALAAALSDAAAQRTRLNAGLELSAMPSVQEAFAMHDTLGLDSAFIAQLRWGRAPWGARIPKFREVEAQLPEIIDRVVIHGESARDAAALVARRIDAILAR